MRVELYRMTSNALNAIARDLEKCDLLEAFGSKKDKAKARKHRKICMKAIKEANIQDGLDKMTAEELLAELTA